MSQMDNLMDSVNIILFKYNLRLIHRMKKEKQKKTIKTIFKMTNSKNKS